MTPERLSDLARECRSASRALGSTPRETPPRERTFETAADLGPEAVEARRMAIVAIHLKEMSLRSRGIDP